MYRALRNSVAVVALLASAGQSVAAELLQDIGSGEGAVSIVAWAGYIERGDTDVNYDSVTNFEESTGCKATVKTATASDEMGALMMEGGSDLVADAALNLIAHEPEMAITNPFELIPEQYDIGQDLLREQREFVNRYWHDTTV